MADQYYLTHPSTQRYYKILAFGLGTYGLKSELWDWYKLPKNCMLWFSRKILPYLCPVGAISQVVYLFFNYSEHEFKTLAMIYSITPVTFMLALKSLLGLTADYKKIMKNFTSKISIYNFYDPKVKQEYVEKMIIKVEKYSRWSSYYLFTLLIVCASSFLIFPMINNYQNNESIHNITTRLEIIIHLWFPFDYEFNFYNYAAIQLIVVYCTYSAILILALFDTVNLIFIYHLIGHIKIFKFRVQQIAVEHSSCSEYELRKKLIELTKYYSFIRAVTKDLEAAFGLNIVGIYLHNLFGGGLLIYQLMSAGTDTGILLSYGLMVPIYMGELLIISIALETVRIEADDIPDLVYNLHWEKMSLQNQKLVLIILLQVQPTLEFNGAFNVKTGIQPALNILKTTFSYYVMIKSRI